jgi:hypothetical protein
VKQTASHKVSPAKLHDLLKLVDSKVHWDPDQLDNGLKRVSPELAKALRHHRVFRTWRSTSDTVIDREAFCISLADQRASAISRRLRGIHASRQVYHVWRDDPTPYGDPDPIAGVYEFACSHSLDEVFEEYKDAFEKRPETVARRDGSSFTSLLTHSELTEAWANFFLNNADYYGIPEQGQTTWDFLKGSKGDRLLDREVLLLRCKLRTHGRLARLRDLQIVKDIDDMKYELASVLGGQLLYDMPDEVLVVARPDVLPELEARVQGLLSTNHFVEFVASPTVLASSRSSKRGFLSNFKELFAGFPGIAHPRLEREIKPDPDNEASSHAIICDLCQMASASVVYPRDVHQSHEAEPINEYLCESCKELRLRSETKAKKLATWEDEADRTSAENGSGARVRPRVCMVKVSLDMGQLPNALASLFEATFPDKLQPGQLDDQDLGFSIIREFLLQYSRFLSKLEKEILALDGGRYSGDNSDHILDGFLALRTERDSEVASIVRKYVQLYDEFFRRLRGNATPIKLSISCSHIKHPFLEHWDVLDNPLAAIDIQSVRRARLKVDFTQFDALEKIGIDSYRVSSFLHNLAEVEARTKSLKLVKFTLLEKHRDAEPVVAPVVAGIVHVSQVLDYYKLFAQVGNR